MIVMSVDRTSLAPLPKGLLFNAVLFITFCLPIAALSSFSGGGVILNAREVGLMALPAIYFLYPDRGIHLINKPIRSLIIFLLILIGVGELLKIPFYGSGLVSVFKGFRLCIAFISMMLILVQGVKIDPEEVKKTLLLTLLTSFVLGIVLGVLGIGPTQVSAEDTNVDVGGAERGRYGNDNASFAFIGLALLFSRDVFKQVFTRNRLLALLTCSLSIAILLLTFNRTMLGGVLLMLGFYLIRRLSVKSILLIAVFVLAGARLVVWFYDTNPDVRNQIDSRILVIWEQGWAGAKKSAITGKREVLYALYAKRYSDYPYIGVPVEERLARTNKGYSSNITDISLVTITLRYGTLSGILFLILIACLFLRFNKKYPGHKDTNKVYNMLALPFAVAFLCSFNIDLLSRQNGICFFVLFMLGFSLDNRLIYHYRLSYHKSELPQKAPLPT